MTTIKQFQIVPCQIVHFRLFLFVCVYFLCNSDVITGQSERIESTDDVTINSSSDVTHAQTIDVLVFIATSGDRELIGSAHSLGVRLAVDDYGLEEGNTTWIRRIIYHDSQCSTWTESRIILDHVIRTGRPTVVLGGGCTSGGTEQDGGHIWRSYAPQVTFEPVTSESSTLSVHPRVSIRPSIGNANRHVLDLVTQMQWSRLSLIAQQTENYEQFATSLRHQLISRSVNTTYYPMKSADMRILDHIKLSGDRVILVFADSSALSNLLCISAQEKQTSERFLWVLVSEGKQLMHENVLKCSGPEVGEVFLFDVNTMLPPSQVLDIFTLRLSREDPNLPSVIHTEAAYAYDAAILLLRSMSAISNSITLTEDVLKVIDDRLDSYTGGGVTGPLLFGDGERTASVQIYTMKDGDVIPATGVFSQEQIDLTRDHIAVIQSAVSIPLWVFCVVVSLATLLFLYTVAIIIFNISKKNNKLIKMTSPNLNIVLLLGVLLCNSGAVLLGLDDRFLSVDNMTTLLQIGTFVVCISLSMIYGAMFLKVWRVYMIFKNLSVNGKLTRDEHLMLGIVGLVLVDLVILLPWLLLDPIQCNSTFSLTVYESGIMSDVQDTWLVCGSDYLHVWITFVYVYKVLTLCVGSYYTYRVRGVTLPSLKDSSSIFTSIFTTLVLMVALIPVLSHRDLGYVYQFYLLAIAIIIHNAVVVTVMFVPKILLFLKETKTSESGDSFRFLFSDSMKKMQAQLSDWTSCWKRQGTKETVGKKYGEELLSQEIDTLKKTIKEKDSTIRELTDRLYCGTEKFQNYLTHKNQKRHWNHDQNQPTNIYSITSRHSHLSVDHPPIISPEPRYSNHPITLYDPARAEFNHAEQFQLTAQRLDSPNIDSAIDNNSPSFSSSEQGSYVIGCQHTNNIQVNLEESFLSRSNLELDVDAMEEEALAKSGAGTPRSLIHESEQRIKDGCNLISNMPSVHLGILPLLSNQEQDPDNLDNSRIGYTEIVHHSLERRSTSHDAVCDTRSVASEPRHRCGDDFSRDLHRRLSYHQHHHHNQKQRMQPTTQANRIVRGAAQPITANLYDSRYVPDAAPIVGTVSRRLTPDAGSAPDAASVTYPGFTSSMITHYPQNTARCKPTNLHSAKPDVQHAAHRTVPSGSKLFSKPPATLPTKDGCSKSSSFVSRWAESQNSLPTYLQVNNSSTSVPIHTPTSGTNPWKASQADIKHQGNDALAPQPNNPSRTQPNDTRRLQPNGISRTQPNDTSKAQPNSILITQPNNNPKTFQKRLQTESTGKPAATPPHNSVPSIPSVPSISTCMFVEDIPASDI